jgi:hypothetical protein
MKKYVDFKEKQKENDLKNAYTNNWDYEKKFTMKDKLYICDLFKKIGVDIIKDIKTIDEIDNENYIIYDFYSNNLVQKYEVEKFGDNNEIVNNFIGEYLSSNNPDNMYTFVMHYGTFMLQHWIRNNLKQKMCVIYGFPAITIDRFKRVIPWDNYKESTFKKLSKSILDKCSKNNYIIIPCEIDLMYNYAGHIGVIMIQKKGKTFEIERFESHGKTCSLYSNNEFDEFVMRKMKLIFGGNIKYTKMNDLIPEVGPQIITGDSFCSAWRLFYTLLRLSNPTINKKYLIKKVLLSQKRKDILNASIRYFITWTCDYISKYKINRIVERKWAYDTILKYISPYWKKIELNKYDDEIDDAYYFGDTSLIEKTLDKWQNKLKSIYPILDTNLSALYYVRERYYLHATIIYNTKIFSAKYFDDYFDIYEKYSGKKLTIYLMIDIILEIESKSKIYGVNNDVLNYYLGIHKENCIKISDVYWLSNSVFTNDKSMKDIGKIRELYVKMEEKLFTTKNPISHMKGMIDYFRGVDNDALDKYDNDMLYIVDNVFANYYSYVYFETATEIHQYIGSLGEKMKFTLENLDKISKKLVEKYPLFKNDIYFTYASCMIKLTNISKLIRMENLAKNLAKEEHKLLKNMKTYHSKLETLIIEYYKKYPILEKTTDEINMMSIENIKSYFV